MRETQWVDWARTTLAPAESEALRAELTGTQQRHLDEHDYVWVETVGVLWKPAHGALHRSRFTHGTHFETRHGEFYIDSEGSVSERARCAPDPIGSRCTQATA